MTRWLLIFLAARLVACPEPEPEPEPEAPPWALRSCEAAFTFDDGASHSSVRISGTFNGWSETADPFARGDDGVWRLSLPLDPGEHAYKLVVDGTWMLDPANPYTMFDAGVLNSRLTVDDCAAPRLVLEPFDYGAAGAVMVRGHFEAGVSEDGPDPAASRFTLDGTELDTAALDATDGTFLLELTGLAEGRHVLELVAADTAGRKTPTHDLPFWIEATPFDWDGALMYFAFTDRFSDGDPANDAPANNVDPIANYQGGDFAGITAAIESGYFEDLGVEVLWLSPVQQNPDEGWPGTGGHLYTGYHGYWPTKARDTQPRFGTLAELSALTRAAHARGMRVLADVVFNHVHNAHPYAAEAGWVNGDGSCVCGSPGCGWEERKLDCWFTNYLPDVNWQNLEAGDAMVDDALWWLSTAGFDGFRVDAVKHFERPAVSNLRGRLLEKTAITGTDFHLVGETFTGQLGQDEIAPFIGPHQLDGQFDFPLYWSIVEMLAREERSLMDMPMTVAASEDRYPVGAIMSPFAGNHDIPRLLSHAAGDIADLYGNAATDQAWTNPPVAPDADGPYDRAFLALGFTMLQRGLPVIYYGDEVGLPGAGDPDNRRMMRFGTDLSVREATMLARVQALGRVRRDTPALRQGATRFLLAEHHVLVWVRDLGGEDVAVVFLSRGKSNGTWNVTLDGDLAGVPRMTFVDALGGQTVVATDGILPIGMNGPGIRVFVPAP